MLTRSVVASMTALVFSSSIFALEPERAQPNADAEARLIEQQKAWGEKRRSEYLKREETLRMLRPTEEEARKIQENGLGNQLPPDDAKREADRRLLDWAMEQERQHLLDTARKMGMEHSNPMNEPARAHYIARIRDKIRSILIVPPDMAGNPEALLDVELGPTGEVRSVVLKQSSGVTVYDTEVRRAVLAAQPLPVPSDPELFQKAFRQLNLRFRPREGAVQNSPANANQTMPLEDTSPETAYGRLISSEIQRFKRYPREALVNGWEGTTEIAVQLTATGDVSKVQLRKSSGWPVLDNEAITMIWAVAPLIKAPLHLQGREHAVCVPIVFQIGPSQEQQR